MESEGVSLPLIHEHLMMPWNDLISRRGVCCGRFIKDISDGYYCKTCYFFVHKICAESSKYIEHSSHSNHTLQLRIHRKYGAHRCCDLCGWKMKDLGYRCEICNFDMDLYCAKYPPPDVIDIYETHHHKLILLKEQTVFNCDAKCGKTGNAFPYKCHECDLSFHVDCVWHPSEVKHPSELNLPTEVNHSYHSLHPLKLLTDGLPDYSDGQCRLCGRMVDDISFYHCSSCNFTLDLRCVKDPPQQSLFDSNTHDHQLTLLPKLISFACNVCGLKGDRSPYLCVQCEFMIHQDCLGLPRLININRHDHRVSWTSLLGVVNSVCGVCRQKVDWTCGGYSCQRCPGYVVHSKCATRRDVWNGKELEGLPEETEDIEPYKVIDENTIQHFSHKEHYLRLQVNGVLFDDNKRCNACIHPISLQSFYNCMDCDFTLHQICAEFPRKKRHVLHNERLTLVTPDADTFECTACLRFSNGFRYQHGNKKIDLRCSSISESFVHPSHPHHPLYHLSPGEDAKSCNGCNKCIYLALRCIEKDCGFVLGFECATLPQVVKHRVDYHPLSLCYGEEASGKYWCDICEKEINPKTWFYTCKDHQASLHIQCVLGDFSGFIPRSIVWNSFEVVLNNSVSRPFCSVCVKGNGFIAKDISFVNFAGPAKEQAVALRSGSDLSAFYPCAIEGYQDTLYVHSAKQFYRECDIFGTVDFIFGNAAVVFQNCNLYARKPNPHQKIVFTAQGRNQSEEPTGISIINCSILAASDLIPVKANFKAYLGRPWRKYSRTVFIKSFIDDLIHPAGWLEWEKEFAIETLYYGEYMNEGPGSNLTDRVQWAGFRSITNATEAAQFTVGPFINGDTWLNSTGIPFSLGY